MSIADFHIVQNTTHRLISRLSISRLSISRLSISRLSISRLSISRLSISRLSISRLSISRLSIFRLSIFNRDILMAAVIEQLSSMLRDVEVLITDFSGLSFTNDELQTLDVLGGRFSDAATAIERKTGTFRPSREEQAWKASETIRTQSQATIAAVLDDGKLKSETVFRRNVVLIFGGPKHSGFDSKEVRSRKTVTQRRCERIRKLSPDGIVAWAISYTPTSWAAGSMGNDVFDCLIDDIEPNDIQAWPTAIRETLQRLRAHEDLQGSSEYVQIVNGEYMDCLEE